ncbi:P-loop containing nucleoside triphosphate hydrolase protein [Halteromyces radiatus]|uniref:P-loop containing nucleoside triphosphate hydrolase protein n=1 Tax=Halteromyces radiatus TaxID=101107 RepID=UPI00221E64E1|nr:P-loop containing nucleoside triphosphate hydrolase protein [Halteromyces radiatus]KAI8096662.1 P-loop containing nucleoside triphosphate hydrolase protein [Halteromyces radiatus]
MGVPPRADRPDRFYNWASSRSRYEYNENNLDENGMAKRDIELEKELFEQDAGDQQTPLDFSRYDNIPVTIERAGDLNIQLFSDADIHPTMKENISLAKYVQPTPVQVRSLPIITLGKDLMACAQTGSGKTAAFLIPTLSALFNKRELAQPRPQPYEARTFKAEPLVLILAPTRELCSQIFDDCRRWSYRSHLRPCAVYGGADSRTQLNQLERGCDILAAAPGRLMDFIERRKVSLERVKYLILDEADRMLDMGFESIIRTIVQKRGLSPDRQTLMFSATFPRSIRKLARDFLRPDYVFLKVGRVGGTSNSITQNILYVQEEEKREALRGLLNSQPPSRTLIFVESKRGADSLDQFLYERSFPSTSIHGDRTQMEREDALLAFKSGQCPILVATAVAARGIDIKNVMHVINYDLPDSMDEYIHRIGRTARTGKSGLATSFYNERSEQLAPEITKLLVENKQKIPDFLEQYVSQDITWAEDLDEEDVPVPSYAGQEWIPQERTGPGAPGSFAYAAGDNGGAANAAFNDSGYGSGGIEQRDGDWNCESCNQSNFARRYECFKCGASRPDNGERRGPPPRRDGDWDCTSCNAVNYARRTDCYKCHAEKDGASGGNNYGYDQPSSMDTPSWNAEPSWSNESATPATSTGGWGAESTEPQASTGGWGAESSAPVATGGWGAESSAPVASTDGWGAESTAPAVSTGGWGAEPAAAEPAAKASTDGWGAEPAAAAPAAASAPAPAAKASTDGWGAEPASAPAAPAAAAPAAPAVAVAEPSTADDGWGAPPAASNGTWAGAGW